jgi:uncharacterized protein YjiK
LLLINKKNINEERIMVNLDILKGRLLHVLVVVGIIIVSFVPLRLSVSAQGELAPIWVVRSIYPGEYGVSNPRGLAFASTANTLLILDENANVALIAMGEEYRGTRNIPDVQVDPLNVAFDPQTNSLFALNRGRSELVRVNVDHEGLPDAVSPPAHFPVQAFGIQDAQGMTFDQATGRLFILDGGKSEIVAVAPHPALGFDAEEAVRSNKVERISLKKLGLGQLRGIAYSPRNGHLYVGEPDSKRLHELTQAGDIVSTFDLAALGMDNSSAMTFAPSGDNTDDPGIYNLFVLDASADEYVSGSQVAEISLVAPEALPAGTTVVSTALVHIIDTSRSAWNPSAPDPSGVEYWPATGRLLVSDSEVDEMSNYFTGKNVYETTLTGSLVRTCSTTNSSRTGFSNEPTGVAINPNNNRIYFTDDDANKLNEVALGSDNTYCTADDVLTSVNIASLYDIQDAEDVAYGNNTLFIAGGDAAEVFSLPLGANGVLGGGDDGPMTHFDTYAMGFPVLEGLGFNRTNGTLLLLSANSSNKYIGETTTSGALLRAYDLSYLTITHKEDVTLGPGSQNAATNDFYINDRGVDNNSDPSENDGKIFEIRASGSSSTPTPTSSGPTPTPTSTPQSTDLIFADDFESGNLSAWSSSVVDAGDLSVTAAAVLVGSKGLQAVIDDNNNLFVTDDRPNAEPRYRVRYYFDPNSISMVSGDNHNIFNGYAGTSTAVVRGQFRFSSGVFQIRFGLLNDSGTWLNTNWFTISDARHPVEIDWKAATAAGANNGYLTLWIDGIQKVSLTSVDNDTRRIDRVRLGAVTGLDTGTRGTYYFDAFVSRRQSYIGP